MPPEEETVVISDGEEEEKAGYEYELELVTVEWCKIPKIKNYELLLFFILFSKICQEGFNVT